MPTIGELISRMFPEGTNPHEIDQEECQDDLPWWPPDVFAVAATLVHRSGCYGHPEFTGLGGTIFDGHFVQHSQQLGLRWAGPLSKGHAVTGPVTPIEDFGLFEELRLLWQVLLDHRKSEVTDSAEAADWWCAALRLLAISDEACRGVGFASAPTSPGDRSRLMALVFDENNWAIAGGMSDSDSPRSKPVHLFSLPHFPMTLCRMVPPVEACVQPKTRAPRVGFTLRSLSHYLALVPPLREVQATWQCVSEILHTGTDPAQPLNLLLVPFPYNIPNGCFAFAGRTVPDDLADLPQSHGLQSFFFNPIAGWLNDSDGSPICANDLAEFLITLIEDANQSVTRFSTIDSPNQDKVHILIIPELALDEERAKNVAHILAERTSIEVFITGVLSTAKDNGAPRNLVNTYILSDGSIVSTISQAKHHRWQLNYDQVKRYDLAEELRPPNDSDVDPELSVFWERIEITTRHSAFWVLRPGASVATLICEDLARIDPVQTYIRAIGPSLVIALLMDGSQIESRWPNRYATVLADDPGCSVLTLTSLGLIRRSREYFNANEQQAVALWRQDGGRSHELYLKPGHHGLVLRLKAKRMTNYTLDGRSDGGRTVVFDYDSGTPIDVRHPAPPRWLNS